MNIIRTLIRWAKVTKGLFVNLSPIEGNCFAVNPQNIDQSLFQKKRKNKLQEQTRLIILEAFKQLNNNPEKYSKPFETFVPHRDWSGATFEETQENARRLGGHHADWVEQALEWAQRINNGETWYHVCNTVDMSDCLRVIIWKDGTPMFIGGRWQDCSFCPATAVCWSDFGGPNYYPFNIAVPLVVYNT